MIEFIEPVDQEITDQPFRLSFSAGRSCRDAGHFSDFPFQFFGRGLPPFPSAAMRFHRGRKDNGGRCFSGWHKINFLSLSICDKRPHALIKIGSLLINAVAEIGVDKAFAVRDLRSHFP